MSLMFISILALNGCMAMTVVSGIIGGVDSVAKEIKINKLEKKLDKLERKGTGNGTKLEPTGGKSTQKDMQ